MYKVMSLIFVGFYVFSAGAENNTDYSSVLLGRGISYGTIAVEKQRDWLKEARARTSEGSGLISTFNKKNQKTASDYLAVFWSYNYLKGRLQVDADWVRATFGGKLNKTDSEFLLQIARGDGTKFSTNPNPMTQRFDTNNYEWLNRFYNILSDLEEGL
jgi:hypothetical protein